MGMKDKYQKYIYKLVWFVKTILRFKIYPNYCWKSSKTNDYIAGRCSYQKKWIKINNQLDSKEVLVTILHESGHVLSYRLFHKIPDVDVWWREKLAVWIGFILLLLSGSFWVLSPRAYLKYHL